MILQDEKSDAIVMNGMGAVHTFQIKASAKAFRILSGFYTDPVGAIPRELGANAWDAHVASGNTDKKFIVHCPNVLEPWFSIRDFGTGLTKEAIFSIYTTYFESTKTSDNDSDGCMGLGSKTPFNYSDNFIVASYVAGVKYVFNCFVNEKSQPSVALMGEEETTEPNGLEIKIAIASDDIKTWKDKIISAYTPFKHKPEIVGENIVFEEKQPKYSGTGWSISDASFNGYYYRSYRNAWYIYMGNYRYSVDFDKIDTSSYYNSLSDENREKIRSVTGNFSGYFDVNIGDVDVAPNKETLQYNKTDITAKKICDMLVLIHDELAIVISDKIVKTINVNSSRISILKEIMEGVNTCRGISTIRKIVIDKITSRIDIAQYDGFKRTGNGAAVGSIDYLVSNVAGGVDFVEYLIDTNRTARNPKTGELVPAISSVIDMRVVSGWTVFRKTPMEKFDKYTFQLSRQPILASITYKFSTKWVFLYDSAHTKTTSKKVCKWVNAHGNEYSDSEIMFITDGLHIVQEFVNYFGFDAVFIDVAAEVPDAIARKINRRTIGNVTTLKNAEFIGDTKLEIDPKNTYYYIPTVSGLHYYEVTEDVMVDGKTTKQTVRKYIRSDYSTIIKCAISCDILTKDDCVYILPKSLHSAVFGIGANMVSVFDVLRKKILKKKNLTTYMDYLKISETAQCKSLVRLRDSIADNIASIPQHSEINSTVLKKMKDSHAAIVSVIDSIKPSPATSSQLLPVATCLLNDSVAFGYSHDVVDSTLLEKIESTTKEFNKNNPNYSIVNEEYYLKFLGDNLRCAIFSIMYSGVKISDTEVQ